MTRIPTGSCLQVYFSMEVINTLQYSKISAFWPSLGQIQFSIENAKHTEKLTQTKA